MSLALFLLNLAILRNVTLSHGLNYSQKANWRSQLGPQRPKMHCNPLGPLEKNCFLMKTTKNARYVRSLEKKTPFWGIHRGLRMCWTWSGALNLLPRGPEIMQIPWGYQKKCWLCRKCSILSVGLKFRLLKGVGWVPQKSAHFGATAPA